jgi:abortive phage resistance protein AbiGi (putative antitoxin)
MVTMSRAFSTEQDGSCSVPSGAFGAEISRTIRDPIDRESLRLALRRRGVPYRLRPHDGHAPCHDAGPDVAGERRVSRQRYVADELTHFLGRCLRPNAEAQFDLLLTIVRSGWLFIGGDPRYTKETQAATRFDPTRPLSDGGMFIPQTVCFCDIPLIDLQIHMEKYGRFGIAFSKEFLLGKGAHPVFYVPREGPAFGIDRAQAMDRIAEYMAARGTRGTRPGDDPWYGVAQTIENEMLCFIKFFNATAAEDDERNTYMEREWRTTHPVQFRLGDVRRIILPNEYGERLRQELSAFAGQVHFAPELTT